MSDMRTPLNRVRGLGSAKEGTDHFWRQRLTAIANIPLVIFFIGFVIANNGASYEEVRAAIANPVVTVRAQPAPYFPLDLPPSDVAANIAPFPREVTEFMVTRDGCDHFRGEEPYDAERRAYIEENIVELCQGTDARLAMLRRRYAGDPSVIAALKGYDSRIETPRSY